MMAEAYGAIGARLGVDWSTLQAHVDTVAQQAAGQAGHGEEWSTDVMLHHIVDARELDLGFGPVQLPELPTIHVGGIAIDLSITKHVFWMIVATILTVVTMWAAARAARRLDQGEEAPGGILGAMEAFYLFLRDEVVMANIGRGGEGFVPLVITFFFFILYSNLLGLVPFGATATGNISVTAGLALLALVVIELAGFRALGPRGYMSTIFYLPPGLPGWLKPIMLVIMTPVELIGKLAKPFALAVRLFANMTAGHFVLLALIGLILTYGGWSHASGLVTIVGAVALGLFVMFLEIFVAFLQAYIFAMLTAVFIGLIRHHAH